MNLLDGLEIWLLSLKNVFEAGGMIVHFSRTDDNRPKGSAVLNLRRGSIEVDLVVWESGEADLVTSKSDGNISQEHFECLLAPEAFASLLARVAAFVQLGKV